MNYLTNEKLVIVGAGGMIGSNMVQTALTLEVLLLTSVYMISMSLAFMVYSTRWSSALSQVLTFLTPLTLQRLSLVLSTSSWWCST